MLEPKKVNLSLKHLKPVNQTKTNLLCNECEHTFGKVLGSSTYEVKCPNCGSFDTEPI